jgi:hypothetical protein
MKLVLEDKEEIFRRLEKPSPDARNLAIAHMMGQFNQESYGGQETFDGIENRVQTGVKGLSASLPEPLEHAIIQFVRDGSNYSGVIHIGFDDGASFPYFSEFLKKRFNGTGKYLWIPTKDYGFGYFNNSTVNDLNPVASVDGVDSVECTGRSIWIGTSGAAVRTFDKKSFEQGFDELGNLSDGYINAYLDYCSDGIKPKGKMSFLKRKRKYSNPLDLTVKLSII